MGARGTKKKTSARAKGKAAPQDNRNRNILLAVGVVAIVAVMAWLLYLAPVSYTHLTLPTSDLV